MLGAMRFADWKVLFFAACTVASVLAGACSQSGPASTTGDAGAPADAGGCVLSSLPLFLEEDGTMVAAAYVPVTYKGSSAAFLVDTGSGLTFLQEPVNG